MSVRISDGLCILDIAGLSYRLGPIENNQLNMTPILPGWSTLRRINQNRVQKRKRGITKTIHVKHVE